MFGSIVLDIKDGMGRNFYSIVWKYNGMEWNSKTLVLFHLIAFS